MSRLYIYILYSFCWDLYRIYNYIIIFLHASIFLEKYTQTYNIIFTTNSFIIIQNALYMIHVLQHKQSKIYNWYIYIYIIQCFLYGIYIYHISYIIYIMYIYIYHIYISDVYVYMIYTHPWKIDLRYLGDPGPQVALWTFPWRWGVAWPGPCRGRTWRNVTRWTSEKMVIWWWLIIKKCDLMVF